MRRIPLIYHTNIKFYTQYTHPMLICRGTDAHTDGRTENIYSIFRDKLLLLGEHVFGPRPSELSRVEDGGQTHVCPSSKNAYDDVAGKEPRLWNCPPSSCHGAFLDTTNSLEPSHVIQPPLEGH